MPAEALERARDAERKRLEEAARGSAWWSGGGSAFALCSLIAYVLSGDYFVRMATFWGNFVGIGLALMFAYSTLLALSGLKALRDGEEPNFTCLRCGAPVYTPPYCHCTTA
jgi:hypothetical protein